MGREKRLNLEHKLQAYLTNARIARAGNHSEVAGGEVARWIVELRVIEDVEELRAELNERAFGNGCGFFHREIGVKDAGAAEEPPVGIAEGTERLRRE